MRLAALGPTRGFGAAGEGAVGIMDGLMGNAGEVTPAQVKQELGPLLIEGESLRIGSIDSLLLAQSATPAPFPVHGRVPYRTSGTREAGRAERTEGPIPARGRSGGRRRR